MGSRTIAAAWVKGIAETLEAAGLDVQALFNEAEMDLDTLNDAHARYPSEKVSHLWELAAIRANNQLIGIAKPEVANPAILDVIAYAMMSCPSLLAGLGRLAAYLRIVSDAATVDLTTDPRGHWLVLHVFGEGMLVPRYRYEFDLITVLNFSRWMTKHDLRPLQVEFTHPLPHAVQPYLDAFHCPVSFNCEFNRILFSAKDLVLSLPTSNPQLAELHDKYAGDYLARLDSSGISYKVRELIIKRLPDGDPHRGDIASALCMSERTLQRRLLDEGTAYHQLVEDTRRELAEQYLNQNCLTLTQAAYLLGFADQSTFYRACKRWFDMPPGQYREKKGGKIY